MKKVLALVLAVIMVCTMAMAIQVGGKPSTTPEADNFYLVNPGTAIAITQKDLDDWGITYLKDTNGNLVPQIKEKDKVIKKSTVNVSFGTGSALVASQGWVEVDKDVWQYQILLKENDTMKLDGKVDLSFSQISYKNTGDLKAQVLKFDDADKTAGTKDDKILFDVGYVVVEVALDEDEVIDFTTWTDLVPDYDELETGGLARGIIFKVLKGDSETGSGHCIMPNTGSAKWEGVIPVRAGETIFVSNPYVFDKDWTAKEAEKYDADVGIDGYNPTAKPASVKVGDYTLLGWDKTTNIYAKNYRTGALVKLAVTMDDGVASFTVPAFSWVASFDGALAGATVETTTETTTNPGTGANDVVGVAAALAVVALVSGAAISLKK